jgi:hypothetical protein
MITAKRVLQELLAQRRDRLVHEFERLPAQPHNRDWKEANSEKECVCVYAKEKEAPFQTQYGFLRDFHNALIKLRGPDVREAPSAAARP